MLEISQFNCLYIICPRMQLFSICPKVKIISLIPQPLRLKTHHLRLTTVDSFIEIRVTSKNTNTLADTNQTYSFCSSIYYVNMKRGVPVQRCDSSCRCSLTGLRWFSSGSSSQGGVSGVRPHKQNHMKNTGKSPAGAHAIKTLKQSS